MTTLDRVRKYVEERESLREILADEGKAVIDRLISRMSLREVARRTGLSPTYLSQIRSGNVAVSPSGFVRLATLDSEAAE